MIGTWFYITLVAKDGECTMRQWHDLPFLPVAGMKFIFSSANDEISETVREVEWAINDGTLWVTLQQKVYGRDCDCREGDECCVLISDLIADYESFAWELDGEVRRGIKRKVEFVGMWNPEDTYDKWIGTEIERILSKEQPK